MRRPLIDEWGNLGRWRKTQPLDKIRDYYGEKVALYFAWLGYYNSMLIFPIIMGICCFIYGLATFTEDVPSQEVCGSMANTQMCPLANGECQTWNQFSSVVGKLQADPNQPWLMFGRGDKNPLPPCNDSAQSILKSSWRFRNRIHTLNRQILSAFI